MITVGKTLTKLGAAYAALALLAVLPYAKGDEAASANYRLQSHVNLPGGDPAAAGNLRLPRSVIGEPDPGRSATASFVFQNGFLAVSEQDLALMISSGLPIGLPATHIAANRVLVSDAYATNTLRLTLSVSNGFVTVSTNLPGGLTGAQVSDNGTSTVVLTGTGAEINTTLDSLVGLLYRSQPDFSGGDTLAISLTGADGLSVQDSVGIQVTPAPPTIVLLASSCFPGGGPSSSASYTLLPMVIGAPDAFDASGPLSQGRFGYVAMLEDDPLLWIRSGSIRAFKQTPTRVDLISISDALNDGRTVTLTLSAAYGSVLLSTSVRGGLTATQVAGNGTHSVTVTAQVGAINATLQYPGGLLYRGDLNFIGGDTLAVALDAGSGVQATGAVAVAVVGSGMDAWLMAHFSAADLADPAKEAAVWGAKADPDGDGRDNLMEYALGLDPNSGADIGQGVTSAIMKFTNQSFLVLTFNRRTNDDSLTYVAKVSGNRQYWSSGPGFADLVDRQPLGEGWERLTYRDVVPIVPGSPRFMRLQVIKNVAPAPGEGFATVDEGGRATIQPTFNATDGDGDPLTVISVTQPAHGSATLNPDGSVTYNSAPGYSGLDAFTYTLDDRHGGVSTGTVSVVVQPVAHAPSAANDQAWTYEQTPVTIDVLANDTCADGRANLRVLSFSRPAHGTLTVVSEGVFSYTADAGYHGTDTFGYVLIAVGNSVYATATVAVEVRQRVDSDGDGMPDDWEIAYGFSTNSIADALLDADGDGVPNVYEFYHKTDPRSAASVPSVRFYVDAGAWAGGTGSLAWPFQNIQDALDMAEAYDIIQVAPGVYRGARNRELNPGGKPVLVRSANGAAGCVVDAEGQGRGFVFMSGEDARTIVRGFQIKNGSGAQGGGICCSNASPSIERCVIISNQAPQGAGVYVAGGAPSLRNCTITLNQGGTGSGIYCATGAVPVLVNTILWSNGASATGGVGQVTARRCRADVALPGADNQVGKPGFAPWSPSHLAAGSPCIDAGSLAEAVWPDVDGEGVWDDPTVTNLVSAVDIGADEYRDTDADRLSDAEERYRGTRIDLADTDGDGFGDGVEIALGTDPLDGTSFPVSIGGTVIYDQVTAGVLRVRCSGGPQTVEQMYAPGLSVPFVFTNLPTHYWYSVDAYVDVNTNGQQDAWEPVGSHGASAFWPTCNVAGLEIRLSGSGPADLFAGDQQAQTGLHNPFLTNAQPVFSAVHWHTHGVAATGYAIQFATAPGGLTGEGTRVNMATLPNGIRSLDIPYGGPALTPGTRIYWRMRFYDANGVAGPWSASDANWFTCMVDADGDGMADDWEAAHGIVSGPGSGVMADPDGDGFGNIYEFWHGTDPTNSASKPAPTLFVSASALAGGDGSAARPFVTIQQALDAAHSYDIVQVAAGTYTGSGNRNLDSLGKPVFVTSPDGSPLVVLDCEGKGRAFFFHLGEDARTVVRGFDIRNGGSAAGGGIAIEGSSPTLRNLIVEKCRTWGDGGGLWLSGGARPALRNVLLLENVATGRGGGLYAGAGSGADLLHCTLKANKAASGSGLFQDGTSAGATVTNTIIWGNPGGAVGGETGAVVVASSVVEGGWPGVDVVSVDPLLTRKGRLMPGSPCIDWVAVVAEVASDIDMQARWDNPARPNRLGIADVGCSEFVDVDGGGLPDLWELGCFGNQSAGAGGDNDGDGLTNLQEYQYGTDPTRADTDGDGMPDGYEVAQGFDPLDPSDGALDSDGDGLTNLQEYRGGTNPHLPDTDGDGLSDAYEVAHGLNPLNPADATQDPNGDGITNLDAQAADVDPRRFNNLLRPVFSPAGGVYVGAQTITVTNPNPIGRIYYTTDGTFPTADSPVLAAGQTVQTPGNGTFTVKARVISLAEAPGPVAVVTYRIRPRAEPSQPVYLGWSADFSGRVFSYSPAGFAGGKYLQLGNGWVVDGAFMPDLASAAQAVSYGEVRLQNGGEVFRIGGFTVGAGGLTLDDPLVLTDQGSGRIEAQGQMIPNEASQP